MKSLTNLLVALMSLPVVTSMVSANVESTHASRELVVAPAELETRLYKLMATVRYGQDLHTQCDADILISVGFIGSEVYVKGLFDCDTDAWIKGTRKDSILEFPNGQYLGSHMFMDQTEHEAWLYNYNVPMQWTYNEETREITPLVGNPGLRNEASDMIEYFSSYDIKDFSKISEKNIQPIILPNTAAPFPVNICTNGEIKDKNIHTLNGEIAFDGDDIYARGLCYLNEDAWIKGALIDGKLAAFPSGQFVGTIRIAHYQSRAVWFFGMSGEDVLFDYDSVTGLLTLAKESLVYVESSLDYNSENHWSAFTRYWNTTIMEQNAIEKNPELITPPTSANRYEAAITLGYVNGENPELQTIDGEFCVDGVDVYVKGLCKNMKDSWIKGSLKNDGSIYFSSEQYLGLNAQEEEVWFCALYNRAGFEMVWDQDCAQLIMQDVNSGLAECVNTGAYIDHCNYLAVSIRNVTAIPILETNDVCHRTAYRLDGTKNHDKAHGFLVRDGKVVVLP